MRYETRDIQNRVKKMKFEKESDYSFYKSLLLSYVTFIFYISFLSLINTRISNPRFEIRDIQNRIKRMKI